MSQRFLVASRKGVFTVDRQPAGDWKVASAAFLGDHAPILAADPRDGAWYVALEHGHFGSKLHRSRDEGATWEEIGVPTYPTPGPGEETTDTMGRTIPWKLAKIWALAPGLASEPGVLWCGTIPGGLFRSTDHGATWSLVESLWRNERRKKWFGGGADLPGIHSICVHPTDAKRVSIAVSCGGVWQTHDGGDSWDCRAQGMRANYMPPELQFDPDVQDPHCMVQCAASPDVLWVQHHNGVFRSTDASASWQEIEGIAPSSFGFPVAVHPRDGDTAWFVPAQSDEKRIPIDGQVVVNRTRDGGKTFQTLRNGLPQKDAYDLVFRHALDVDSTGDTLAFGSTTGGLWVSSNQGDSWQTVSLNLPPIYCVRSVTRSV